MHPAGLHSISCSCHGGSPVDACLLLFVRHYCLVSQGLNIAPALIVVAPTKEIVNPVGPLAISDTLIEDEVPALP